MSKTLTITLNNIDDLLWERGWDVSRETIEHGFGITLPEPDNIQIDVESFRKRRPRIFADLMSVIFTAYGTHEIDKVLDQRKNETTDI